ncbi:MFS transporter [Streptomyces sp. NPDC005573]|uniref:MFS transporter n=1 Tax=Streptomyces sp. NPDC005573 TaxID=3156890 RepID=UPI0033BC841F
MPETAPDPAVRRTGEQIPDALAERTLRKVRRRVLPVIVLLYLVAYLDRNNVGFARAGLEHDLGFGDAVYGLGAGIFFIGYVLMEVPSNAGMYRYGARRWIARILVSWGVMALAMAFVQGATSFYTVRLLLGAAEAGFFPAVLFYFTLWFPEAQRVAALGVFVMAQPVANALGAPLSGLLLHLDGVAGLHGWQWMFLLEGAPAVVLGCLAPRLLTDTPADARWLTGEERIWLTSSLEAERADKPARQRGGSFATGLKDRRSLVYGLLNFGMVCGIYGLGLWLPAIVDAMGDYSSTLLGLLVMIPYAVAVPCVLYWSRRADRTGRRAWHAAVSMATAAAGLAGAALVYTISPAAALLMLVVAAVGIYTATAPFLAMPSAALAGAAAAAGLGLVNALGNVGGFVAPYAVGLIKDGTGDIRYALLFLAACLALTALLVHRYAAARPEGTAPGRPAAPAPAAANLPAASLPAPSVPAASAPATTTVPTD